MTRLNVVEVHAMGRKQKARRHSSRSGKHRARSRARLIGFIVMAIFIIGAAVLAVVLPLRPRLGAVPPVGTQVVINMAGFSPARLQARAGTDLTLTLLNPDNRFHTDGGGWHQFRIEALNVDVRIPPLTQKMVTLRGLRAGTYEFYCDICCGGKSNPSMRGILEVTS